MPETEEVTRHPQPIVLVRGYGGLRVEDEKRNAYQGFNDGTVYPHRRGENYIYEGLILRFLKSEWRFQDATNVVNYYGRVREEAVELPEDLQGLDAGCFSGHKIVIDPAMALRLIRQPEDPCRTLWVFRYYDLDDREFRVYAEALVRLIQFIRALVRLKTGHETKVNIVAHSMGGLIVREAVQMVFGQGEATRAINKIATLGTPHRGISFQVVKRWIAIDGADELERFNPDFQENRKNQESYLNFHKHFPVERLLTVVGTNYQAYGTRPASWANRWFGAEGEGGPTYNRSDGLVKQISAQIPGAPRTFVHKCHGGEDSLVTSREAFEIITRFFFGNIRVRLRLVDALIKRGRDAFGRSEYFFGVSVKPRRVDFELFHQSKEAENCYGPFRERDLSDAGVAFAWAGGGRLIWEGWLDTRAIERDPENKEKDLVVRLECYVSERDTRGIGFSDNVIFSGQVYVRALLPTARRGLSLALHTSEDFSQSQFKKKMKPVEEGWQFSVGDRSFEGTLQLELERIPEYGPPEPLVWRAGEGKDQP
ncbi:MAG TPA: hypothetical protein PK847_09945 [Candidatus Sumerlaeota bacterium]|nr:hypothetical protein [Candidatus Sumerlaeota bacterium]